MGLLPQRWLERLTADRSPLLRYLPAPLLERIGAWEIRHGARWRQICGGEPFNGQRARQRMFLELCWRLKFVAVVETGTNRGATTAHLHEVARCPLHSFEIDPRYYGFARARLAKLAGVRLHRGDSRAGIAHLAATAALPPGPVLFYLDAHWLTDLPLADEIRLAFRHWREAVVMIDDFAVPDDPGYGFDDYREQGSLTLDYLDANGVRPPGVWFPSCDSAEETGARRGCVVLACAPAIIERIDAMDALRRWRNEGNGSLDPNVERRT